MTVPTQASAPIPAVAKGPRSGARRVTATGFAAQGTAVAAVFTTVPSVKLHLGMSSLLTTVLMVAVSLAAGAGSFAGLAAVRRLGPVTAMRAAVLAAAAALLLIGWAPGESTAIPAYLLFGVALGGLDVSMNTRAAAVERAYGRSIFSSFYAAWSAGGVVAALLTAGMSDLGWSPDRVLTVQAAIVLGLAWTIRSHSLAGTASPHDAAPQAHDAAPQATVSVGKGVWARLVPLGIVLLVAYVVDSTVSAWSTVYLHQTLAASLATAPLAYAAYQTGTILGRSSADRLVRAVGPATVIRVATLLTAAAMAALAAAPSWMYAIPAAGLVGVGISVLAPLCFAAAGRLQPEAAEAILARLNLFNYAGVISGAAASGLLGSSGHFRLAYAIPAALTLFPLAVARGFDHPAGVREGSISTAVSESASVRAGVVHG